MLRVLLSLLCSGAVGTLASAFWHESIGRILIGTKNGWMGYHWNSSSEEYITTALVFVFFSFFAFLISYNRIFKKMTTFKNVAMDIVANSKDIINSKSITYAEAGKENIQYYGQAEDEINNRTMQKDLWALALVKAKGKEDLRKVEYIKLRVKQLQNEE